MKSFLIITILSFITLSFISIKTSFGFTSKDPNKLKSNCDDRDVWCLRGEDSGHGIPKFIDMGDPECYNYDFGVLCALSDHQTATARCNHSDLTIKTNGNQASIWGDTIAVTHLWGQNGDAGFTHTDKTNIYLTCNV